MSKCHRSSAAPSAPTSAWTFYGFVHRGQDAGGIVGRRLEADDTDSVIVNVDNPIA
jgi:hypothetical protein